MLARKSGERVGGVQNDSFIICHLTFLSWSFDLSDEL